MIETATTAMLQFSAIVILVVAISGTVMYGLMLHHKRELYRHSIREIEITKNAELMREAMEKGLRLPERRGYD